MTKRVSFCGIATLAAALVFAAAPAFAADAAPAPVVAPAAAAPGPWAVSIFGGALTERVFAESLVVPGDYASSGIIGADLTYSLYTLPNLPLKLELDGTAAKRFDEDHEWDFGFAPTLRWTAFPWNQWLYTNLRVAPLGVSYVTGISPWELHWAGNDHGSRFLNLFAVEIDFRTAETSPFEVYVGWRHRSGAWGLWNGTHGGSTYETAGLRYHF